MKNHFKSNIVNLKPTCAGCREPLRRPTLKLEGRDVCRQCFEAHVSYWQNFINHERVTHGHLIMRGGLTHNYGKSL